MTYTTDTLTGKRFRYSETTRYLGLTVPCRYTTSRCMVLAPSRVPLPLLQQLNPDVRLDTRSDVLTIEHESRAPVISPLSAAGGAAPLMHDSTDTHNAGIPYRNRRGEGMRFGRTDRAPGCE